ncbi:MAG: hypothetical protein MUC36_28145 [Planctomycetes bacterium]|nr:hypothetical protein [Planctomycetota bacterium]
MVAMLQDRIQLTALPNINNDTYVVLASRVARQWTGIDPPIDRVVTATFRWNPDQSLPASDYDAACDAAHQPGISRMSFLDSIGFVVSPGCFMVGGSSARGKELLFVESHCFDQAPSVGDLMHEGRDEVICDLPAWDWDVVVATAVSNLGFDLERELLWRSAMSGRGAVIRSWHSRLDYGDFHCCKIEQSS